MKQRKYSPRAPYRRRKETFSEKAHQAAFVLLCCALACLALYLILATHTH